MKKYDVKYFINKFEKIPEDKWTTKVFTENGKCCSLGHCGQTQETNTVEASKLVDIFNNYFPHATTMVNDGLSAWYTTDQDRESVAELGDTPKERIINALCIIDSGMLEDV